MSKDIKHVDGAENVFADIGVRDPEDSRVRANLAFKIAQLIKKRGLRQVDVAKLLQADQAKVSKLVRGRISGFTSDRLFRYLQALSCDVKIELKETRTQRIRGRIEVVSLSRG
jgi:predicted XRE-type DNA-binding protein